MAKAIPKNPYKVVPLPAGYRRALPKEITPKVQRAAVRALQQCLPLGKMQATEVDGKLYMFITEGHYDDHVTKPGKPIWHPGISTVVPINQPQPVKVASQSVRDAQFINMSRMTGENDSSFEGESLWAAFKRWLRTPAAPSTPRPAPTAAQKKQADDAAAAALVLSQMRGDGFYGRPTRKPKLSLAERRAKFAAFRARMGEEVIDDPNYRADVGFEFGAEENLESLYAADELYDAVNGEDFEMDSVGTDFGDDFGKFNLKKSLKKAVSKKGLKKFAKGSLAISTGGLSLAASKKGRKVLKKVATPKGIAAVATGGLSLAATKKGRKQVFSKKGLAAIATGGASLALAKKNRALTGAVLTGGLSLAAKSQRKAVAARVAPKKAAPRPVARTVTRPAAARLVAARPVAPRTTPTKTDSPLGPSAPFDETVMAPPEQYEVPMEAEQYEAPTEAEQYEEEESYEEEGPSEEVEAALDAYEDEEGGEETPETADEGSDTYDETAINGEDYTHSKYSIGA